MPNEQIAKTNLFYEPDEDQLRKSINDRTAEQAQDFKALMRRMLGWVCQDKFPLEVRTIINIIKVPRQLEELSH